MNREMIPSTLAIQNLVVDLRETAFNKVKPHPAMFTQNEQVNIKLKAENSNLWIENCYVGERWTIEDKNIITGVLVNDWELHLPHEVCLDVEPIGDTEYVLRPYGFNDAFKGALVDEAVPYQGRPMVTWLAEYGLIPELLEGNRDLQAARLFPVCESIEEMGQLAA